jgi:tRNA(fMet)-specific endonuclease VapC
VTKYLLDTNICIYLVKGQFNIHTKIDGAGIENCFISEITVAELKYGVEKSKHKVKNSESLNALLELFVIVPIYSALDVYAAEKARLKLIGRLVDDFDLLIGATAIANNFTLVTRNTSDFDRLIGITMEDWTK